MTKKSLLFIWVFLACLGFANLAHAEEQTVAIIKPDAVRAHHIGEIITVYEKNGFQIKAIKTVQLTTDKAKAFYVEHKDKPFYPSLVEFMTSGPVIVMVLEGDNAVAKNRELMEKTIRKEFGTSKQENAIHGSDSANSAQREIPFFFTSEEIVK